MANISKTEFRLQFEGFEEQHNSECDADRVVGEILSGILWKWMRHKPRHSTHNDPKSIIPFGNLQLNLYETAPYIF